MNKIFKTLAITSLLAGLTSCGSAGTSNDQGVSFTLYGMFRDATCETGLTGLLLPLSSDPEANGSGTGAIAALGLQNNMTQAIRTRRVFMKYYIEGAEVQPPSTSQPLGLYMAPGAVVDNNTLVDNILGEGNQGEGEEDTGGGESAVTSVESTACGEFVAVPSEILSYLSFNRASLPELPYKMRVEISVSGIGSAGDEYMTNPLDLYVEVLEDNIITPTTSDTDDTENLAAIEESLIDNSGQNSEIIPIEDVE